MTTKEAAKLLNVTPRRVQALITNGRLAATKEGRDWRITTQALKALVRYPAHRPRKDMTCKPLKP